MGSAKSLLPDSAPHEQMSSIAPVLGGALDHDVRVDGDASDTHRERVRKTTSPESAFHAIRSQDQGADRTAFEPAGKDPAAQLSLGIQVDGGRPHQAWERMGVAHHDGAGLSARLLGNPRESHG